jgi:hypothetical protein
MHITDLKTWKILDTVYDLIWTDDHTLFTSSNRLEKVDLFECKIFVFKKRKEANLARSLWKVTYGIAIREFDITEILECENSGEKICSQLAMLTNRMFIDNKFELYLDKWKVLDSTFTLQWCQYWEEMNCDQKLVGLTDFNKTSMKIYKDSRSESELWETLFHETIHVWIKKMPIKPLEALDDTNEQEVIIDQIGVIINTIIQDNPFITELKQFD